MAEIEALSRRIAEEFDPDKIILFGSYAYGNPTEDSDVDLLVILPFEGRNLGQSAQIRSALTARFPIDVLARTPEEVARRYSQGNPLIQEALDDGKVLYERRNHGVARHSRGRLCERRPRVPRTQIA